MTPFFICVHLWLAFFFTTKDTKSTKKRQTGGLVPNFVSFVLFVVDLPSFAFRRRRFGPFVAIGIFRRSGSSALPHKW
jgi:hypothetical protein